MDWSGVDYCDVIISCLDFNSDGTHSLQRIHWGTNNAEFSKSFPIKFLFWVNFSFKGEIKYYK